ncbi:hypothetical protein D3C76_1661710 [compost metagenome]
MRHAGLCLLPILGHQGAHKIDLGWEMMVDAGLADTHVLGDVRITETAITAGNDQGSSAAQDFEISAGMSVHRATLPSDR